MKKDHVWFYQGRPFFTLICFTHFNIGNIKISVMLDIYIYIMISGVNRTTILIPIAAQNAVWLLYHYFQKRSAFILKIVGLRQIMNESLLCRLRTKPVTKQKAES